MKFISFTKLADVNNRNVGLVTLAFVVVKESGTAVLVKLKGLH
jgi:hypothetical protein